MNLLKFSFYILGFLIFVLVVTQTIYSFIQMSEIGSVAGTSVTFFSILTLGGYMLPNLAIALFCLLGGKLTGILQDRSAQADVRNAVASIRHAGDKTDV